MAGLWHRVSGGAEAERPSERSAALRVYVRPPRHADEEEFVADNVRFFAAPLPGRDEALGDAGGSAETGVIGVDTELVAKWEKD